jgi:hypothetical protein
VVAGVCGFAGLRASAAQPLHVETVALTGRSAAGVPGGVFADLGQRNGVRINASGQVLFQSSITGPGINSANGFGLWSGTPGNLGVVAREGGASADGHIYTSLRWDTFNLNDAGLVALVGQVQHPVTDGQAILSGPPGALRVLALKGDPAPETPFNYQSLGGAFINNAGQVAFTSYTYDGHDQSYHDYGIFTGVPGDVRAVTYQGQTAQGTGGLPFASFESLHITPSGRAAFEGKLPQAHDQLGGLWLGTPGDLQVVATPGGAAPGFPGHTFNEADGPFGFNHSGEFAFRAFLGGGGMAVYKQTASAGLKLLLKSGDPAPDVPGDIWIHFRFPKINDHGQLAVEAHTLKNVANPDGVGIWGGSEGNLHLLVASGAHAPGTPNDVTFREPIGWTQELNDNGLLAFAGMTRTPGGSYGSGIWVADLNTEQVFPILLQGEGFDVGGGDVRTVQSFALGRGFLIGEDFFNDANQLALNAKFTDGSSGVFVVTVPEPGASAAVGICGAMGLLHRRRRPN